jgi:hypothetical protein
MQVNETGAIMSKSWTFTTFENGRPVARHAGLSNRDAAETLARAMNPLFDVENKLENAERQGKRAA